MVSILKNCEQSLFKYHLFPATTQTSAAQWIRSRTQSDLSQAKNSMPIKNSWTHVKKCLFVIVVYMVLIAIWIVIDNHHEIELESNERYKEETDTFFITFTKDCTSDHFIQWASALVSLLIVPMFISILLIIAMGNMKKKASESEKWTILALINIVAISTVVLFAVLLANSFVIQKIIISLACLIISISNSITMNIRAKY